MSKANESNIDTSEKVVAHLNQEALSESEANAIVEMKSAVQVEDYVLFTGDESRSFNGGRP